MPKKNDPLTVEEMTEAAEIFFPLFNEVNNRMPKGASTEDALKVMESVAKLGHKLRSNCLKKSETFGFNKRRVLMSEEEFQQLLDNSNLSKNVSNY